MERNHEEATKDRIHDFNVLNSDPTDAVLLSGPRLQHRPIVPQPINFYSLSCISLRPLINLL